MKKIFSVVLAAAVTMAAASAEGVFTLGAKGALQFNAGTELPDGLAAQKDQKKVLLGGGGGIFARFSDSKGIGVQLEMLFTGNNGLKMESSSEDYYGDHVVKTSASYAALDIPLLVTYDINLGPVILTPFAGPNFSIPIGMLKLKSEADGKEDSEDEYSIASRFIPGVAVGLAAGFPVGPGAIVVEVRYLRDFMEIAASFGEKGKGATDIAKRGAFGACVGWQFMF